MKVILKIASLSFCFALVMTLFSCSNGSDGNGGTNPISTTASTYTITFNANDGSQSPATATQTFTSGETRTLKSITELGFSKYGFYFGGWGTSADASESSYTDGANYTACSDITLYALWSSISAVTGDYTENGTTTINNVEYDLVTFGLWPQTIKAANVEVNEQYEAKTVGDFTYYKGSDGQWYAKLSNKYYKVEPIKWRVLTSDYNGTGRKLLLAENVLIGKRYDDDSNSYQNSEIRKWLNSNANSAAASDHSGSEGFLKAAFTAEELAKIADTSVNNSARSTNPNANATQWNSGNNPYASDTPTTDKVFLLSEQEATKSEYGFDVYDAGGIGNARIRKAVDYAYTSGATAGGTNSDLGSWWWLRSPSYHRDDGACNINSNGHAGSGLFVTNSNGGVAPALCVSN